MLLAKFTHVLKDHFQFRQTDEGDRTDDDYEILEIKMYDETEFGTQGSLFCWYGGEKEFDSDSYDTSDDWGSSAFFFGFQNFLEFYTTPTKIPYITKFVLYTPSDDWSHDGHVVIDEIEFAKELQSDLDIEDLIIRLFGNKYQLKKVTKESLKKYLE